MIDFGVAKAIQQKLSGHKVFTEVGQIIGTVEYIAPEQAEVNNNDWQKKLTAALTHLRVVLQLLLTVIQEKFVKSVRFDPSLQCRLERAARALAQTQSEFIRDAVAHRCEEVLGSSLVERLAPVLGTVKSKGGRVARTGDAFRKIISGSEKDDPD